MQKVINSNVLITRRKVSKLYKKFIMNISFSIASVFIFLGAINSDYNFLSNRSSRNFIVDIILLVLITKYFYSAIKCIEDL